MDEIRVIVIDDEVSIAMTIADALAMEDDIRVVGVGHNGVDAIKLTSMHLPDVVLLDLKMPVMGGLEALQEIKKLNPTTQVLVLTIHDDNDHLFTALQTGAKGYLLKGASLDNVIGGVREVARGMAAIPPALATRVLAEFQRIASQTPAIRDLYSLLTRQEMEVLKLIGAGKTNKQISDVLSVELTTVKKHITNIRHKLEVNSRTEAILIARSSGLTSS